MIDAVLDAVVAVLDKAGICAFREFPARAPVSGEVCVTVGARGVKCLSSGLGDYLGVRLAEDGGGTEIFGKRLELELGFEVFSAFDAPDGAAECVRCADEILGMAAAFPVGVKVLEMHGGEVSADEGLRVFKCACSAKCLAFFVAEAAGEEQGEFLDFVLKGAVDDVSE